MTEYRRVAILSIHRKYLLDTITGDIRVKGLPKDIELEQVYYNPKRDQLQLVVTSEKFDEVPEGGELPFLMGEIHTKEYKEVRYVIL